MPHLLGLDRGQTDRSGLGVGEKHLGHRVDIGCGDVGATGVVSGARGREHRWRCWPSGLILALMGQQGSVIGVAWREQSPSTPHQAGVIDIEPRSRRQVNRFQSDIAGAGRAASGEQYRRPRAAHHYPESP